MSNQVLERFHRALIEEIQTQRPDYLTGPFTVAEIYQNLVPYGSHRDRIGVEMNGDYEDALMRLLAGEGDFLVIDSEPALMALRAEVESPNPNTGLYREFAAVDVRLNQQYLDLSAAALDDLPDLAEELEVDDPVSMTELAPGEEVGQADLGIVPPGVDIFADAPTPEVSGPVEEVSAPETEAPIMEVPELQADPAPGPREAVVDHADDVDPEPAFLPEPIESAPVAEAEADSYAAELRDRGRARLQPEFVEEAQAAAADPSVSKGPALSRRDGGRCAWCSESLPDRSPLNFCPFCGTDQQLVPCRACGEAVEPGWRYCASCGTEADD